VNHRCIHTIRRNKNNEIVTSPLTPCRVDICVSPGLLSHWRFLLEAEADCGHTCIAGGLLKDAIQLKNKLPESFITNPGVCSFKTCGILLFLT